jgi:hypothetical protein
MLLCVLLGFRGTDFDIVAHDIQPHELTATRQKWYYIIIRSAPTHPAIYTANLPNQSCRRLASCCRSRMTLAELQVIMRAP